MDNEQSMENTDKAGTASAVDSQQGGANNRTGLDPILDIQVKMTLEIGSTSLPIRDLLNLSQGSLVTLDSLVGQPHDVLVNGTLIAKGEVVVTDEKFAIRFTEIVSPSERINSLT
jgi:flagellar motor switch protein FliN